MICERCGKEFEEDYRRDPNSRRKPMRFCSTSCANTRKHSRETKQRISRKVKYYIQEHKEERALKAAKLIEAGIKTYNAWGEITEKKLLETPFENLSFGRLRKRILIEQQNCCARCGLSEWQGLPIILEVDHKDGNHANNERENIEALCPNCHSLTDTWKGRNKMRGVRKPVGTTDEAFVQAFLSTGNIRQALLLLGLAAKGANYGRMKRALSLRGISYK